MTTSDLAGEAPPPPRIRWWSPGRRRCQVRSGPAAAERWTGGPRLLTLLFGVLLVAAIVTGPVALGLLLTRGTGPVSAAPAQESPDRLAREAAARSVALDAVSAWLTTPAADASALGAWWPTTTVTLPDTPLPATGVTVLGATATAPGVWQISLAATITPQGKAPERRFYVLPVAVSGGVGTAAAQPLTLPAQVAAPGGSVSTSLPYTIPVPTSSPAGTSVAGFLQAMLTGRDDVTRWESPTSTIEPVTASSTRSVTVTDIDAASNASGLTDSTPPADGSTVQVLATARSGPTATAATTSQYLLTLRARAGRWEVLALDSAPAQSAPASSSTNP